MAGHQDVMRKRLKRLKRKRMLHEMQKIGIGIALATCMIFLTGCETVSGVRPPDYSEDFKACLALEVESGLVGDCTIRALQDWCVWTDC